MSGHRSPREEARRAALDLLAYGRANDWAGYDPYDALNSRLFKLLPFLNFRLARLALTQAVKRSPVNLRPLLLALDVRLELVRLSDQPIRLGARLLSQLPIRQLPCLVQDLRPLAPQNEIAFSTHAMSPESVLALAAELYDAHPPAWMLAIRGCGWEPTGLPTDAARSNLSAAREFLQSWIRNER